MLVNSCRPVVTSFSTAIVELQQAEGKLDQLESLFIKGSSEGCDYSGDVNVMQIGFYQVGG